MGGSIFALLLGLALLGLAVWLLLRAKKAEGAGSGVEQAAEGTVHTEDPEGLEEGLENEEYEDYEEYSDFEDYGYDGDYPEDEDWEGDPDYGDAVDSTDNPDGEEWSEAWDGPQFDDWSGEEDTPEKEPVLARSSAPAPAMAAFGFPRRRRRQWAADNGFEYTKEDSEVARDWPVTITGDHQRGVPTLREVVSGFIDGHQVHIGDLGSSTLMAMRRVEESPVQVLYSAGGAQPAGMRRTDLLDQPPFAAYTTDVRALDRMLDARVEDALAALSQVATDVAWGQNWTVVRISRKLDFHVWQAIFPQLRSLVDAAMVLPPAHTSAPLEMFVADQLRPLPGGPLQVHTTDPVNQEAIEEQAAETSSRRAHLRAVPDGNTSSGGEGTAEGEEADTTAAHVTEEQAEEVAAHSEVPNPEHPDITRPAEPVAFPSRTHARWEGGDTESFESFAVGDYDDADADDDPHAGRRRRRDGGIPRLGEDPEHMSSHFSQYARVIRDDAEEATIFDELEDFDEFAEVEETKSTAVRLSPVTQRRRSRGRHRAPEARHARPEPIEPIEYETVDGEIVEDDQQ